MLAILYKKWYMNLVDLWTVTAQKHPGTLYCKDS